MTDWSLIHGDCMEHLSALPDECITAVVTDPPYALNFMGKGWDKVLPSVDVWREASRVTEPGGMLLAFGGTRTFHRLACDIEDAGWQIRDCLCWLYGSGFPKSHDISKAIDKAAGAEREVIGSRISRQPTGNAYAQDDWTKKHGVAQAIDVTAPATDAARIWSGYGTALKPAWEPIILAMKPLDGTFAQNAQQHGVAGINVEACKIHAEPGDKQSFPVGDYGTRGMYGKPGERTDDPNPEGRWPANVVLDEEAAKALDAQSGIAKPKNARRGRKGGNAGALGQFAGSTPDAEGAWPADPGGGASRFFYCAKASKRDRNTGLPKGESNDHPTVKPVELMRWLIRLVTMPSGTCILDPFAGSGSTGVACALEGVDFLGCERDEESAQLAQKRIEGTLEAPNGQ